MYAYISGILTDISPDSVVVENHGIGYRLHIPGRSIQELPPAGERVKIYTYLYVREDAFMLYGFLSQDEAGLFAQLIAVSGIGPKGAIGILSVMSPDEVRFALMREDDKAFAKAPGIGKKTAQRLIIELKDKVQIEDTAIGQEMSQALTDDTRPASAREEAVLALTALGYSAYEASKAVESAAVGDDADTETVLKEALRQMALF